MKSRSASPRRPTRPRSTRSAPTACSTCRARSTSTTSSRCSSRAPTSSRRAASSSRGGQPPRRRAIATASLDACARGSSSIYATGQQPGVHHRHASVRAAVDAAPRRVGRDRGVRRTCRGATRRTCCSSRWGSVSRSSSFDDRRSSYLLGEFGPPLGAARRGRGPTGRRVGVQGRGRGSARATTTHRRRRAAGRIGRRAAHDDRRHAATATTSCASRRTGTARPTSNPRGTCGRPAGACACAATRRSTSSSRSRSRVDDLGSFTPAYTANRPVNAIPYVCAAPPGILVTADLPPITPAGPRHG